MSYTMTPARKAALRKAQRASARKRRGKGKGKLAQAHRRARRNAKISMAANGLVLVGAAGALTYSNRGVIKARASNNPRVRKYMTKKMMKKARKRRASRG
jgi:hypothetical protein